VTCKGSLSDTDAELDYRSTAYNREIILRIGVDVLPDVITQEIQFLRDYLGDLNYALGELYLYNEVQKYLPYELNYLGNNWFRFVLLIFMRRSCYRYQCLTAILVVC